MHNKVALQAGWTSKNRSTRQKKTKRIRKKKTPKRVTSLSDVNRRNKRETSVRPGLKIGTSSAVETNGAICASVRIAATFPRIPHREERDSGANMGENKRQPACTRRRGVTRNGQLAFSTLKLLRLICFPAFDSLTGVSFAGSSTLGPLICKLAEQKQQNSAASTPERVEGWETHQACRETILSRLASTHCCKGKSHHAGRNRRTGGEVQFLSCFHRCQFVAGADESIATQDSPFFSASCFRQPRGR